MISEFSVPSKIKEEIESRLGFKIKYPADCERLSISIRSAINETIGVTTLKRLFGFVSDEQAPRVSTLDILARYCGFSDYEEMKREVAPSGDSDFEEDPDIVSESLKSGSIVKFEYLPDRRVTLIYIGDSKFRVKDCKNGSLRKNDILSISCFNNGYPLVASSVIRNGENLGRYVAGKHSGITDLYLALPADP